jgi:uncharacterized small protein (DUF1192 family)
MISGNKGFKKRLVSKSHKPKHGANFRNDRSRKAKKKGSPLSGVAVLPETKINALLQEDDPTVKAERERKAAQEAERKLSRATFAHEMELISINEENTRIA